MKPKDGRKALVIFSDGVDRGSKETMNDAIDAADRAGVQVFTIYFKGEEERQERLSRQATMAEWAVVAAIPAAEAVGPAAAGAVTTRAAPTHRNSTARRSCRRLPRAPAECFSKPRRKTISMTSTASSPGALRQEYLLTYTPDKADTDGDFHKIALKTDKPDLTIITREGYYASGGD